MRIRSGVTNVVIAGLGGQGVLRASDILAEAVFRSGLNVKKSEIHGMSQRGGSITSDIRFGDAPLSPMIPAGEAHYLVVLAPNQVEQNLRQLCDSGVLIAPGMIDQTKLASKRSLNVALLGILSSWLEVSEETWLDAIRNQFAEKLHDDNIRAFALGRHTANSLKEQHS